MKLKVNKKLYWCPTFKNDKPNEYLLIEVYPKPKIVQCGPSNSWYQYMDSYGKVKELRTGKIQELLWIDLYFMSYSKTFKKNLIKS